MIISTDCLGMWFGGHGVISRNGAKLVVPAVHANHLLFSSLYLAACSARFVSAYSLLQNIIESAKISRNKLIYSSFVYQLNELLD